MCGPLILEVCEWLTDIANIATIIGVILAIIAFFAARAIWPGIVNFYNREITAQDSTVADRGSMSGPSIHIEGARDVTINPITNQSMTMTELDIEED